MIRKHSVLAILGTVLIALAGQLPPVAAQAQVTGEERRPLIIVDGVVLQGGTTADRHAVLRLIGLAIESIEVLKGQAAVERYGAAAADGVISVRLKGDFTQTQLSARLSADRDTLITVSPPHGQEVSPLLVINGVVMPIGLAQALNPQDIDSIEVIKGAAAVERYGERARAGVIHIVTRKQRSP